MDWGLAKELASGRDAGRAATASRRRRDATRPATPRPTDDADAGGRCWARRRTWPRSRPAARTGRRAGPTCSPSAASSCAILTGQPPFAGGPSARGAAQRPRPATWPTRSPGSTPAGRTPSWSALAKRCLAPDPADRPADGGAVADAVAAYRAAVEERLRAAERRAGGGRGAGRGGGGSGGGCRLVRWPRRWCAAGGRRRPRSPGGRARPRSAAARRRSRAYSWRPRPDGERCERQSDGDCGQSGLPGKPKGSAAGADAQLRPACERAGAGSGTSMRRPTWPARAGYRWRSPWGTARPDRRRGPEHGRLRGRRARRRPARGRSAGGPTSPARAESVGPDGRRRRSSPGAGPLDRCLGCDRAGPGPGGPTRRTPTRSAGGARRRRRPATANALAALASRPSCDVCRRLVRPSAPLGRAPAHPTPRQRRVLRRPGGGTPATSGLLTRLRDRVPWSTRRAPPSGVGWTGGASRLRPGNPVAWTAVWGHALRTRGTGRGEACYRRGNPARPELRAAAEQPGGGPAGEGRAGRGEALSAGDPARPATSPGPSTPTWG